MLTGPSRVSPGGYHWRDDSDRRHPQDRWCESKATIGGARHSQEAAGACHERKRGRRRRGHEGHKHGVIHERMPEQKLGCGLCMRVLVVVVVQRVVQAGMAAGRVACVDNVQELLRETVEGT